MKFTTKIDKKFLSFKEKEKYLLSTPITMMEDELSDIGEDFVIAEKKDGNRVLIIHSERQRMFIRENECIVTPSEIEGDYVLDCEEWNDEICVLDVLYANRDVTMEPLHNRLRTVKDLPYRKQLYFGIRDIYKVEDAVEGWVVQSSTQDYTSDMLVYKVKRVPSIDVMMRISECKKLGIQYDEQFEGKLVEYAVKSKRVLRERLDKVKPNDYSVMAREMAEDRVTYEILISFLKGQGFIRARDYYVNDNSELMEKQKVASVEKQEEDAGEGEGTTSPRYEDTPPRRISRILVSSQEGVAVGSKDLREDLEEWREECRLCKTEMKSTRKTETRIRKSKGKGPKRRKKRRKD